MKFQVTNTTCGCCRESGYDDEVEMSLPKKLADTVATVSANCNVGVEIRVFLTA